MGLGKTATTLTAASDLLLAGEIKRVLIIAPLRVANTVWHSEASNWEHLRHLTVSVCTGSAEKRKRYLNDDANIHVINRENIPWVITNCKWRWDMVIIDESTGFKNHASKRFKALKAACRFIKYHVNLTGTPKPNGYQDLWSQMYFVDQGKRLGRNITAFRKQYMYQAGFNGYEWRMRDGAAKVIQEAIKDVCLTMQSDYGGRIEKSMPIELPASVRSQYKVLEREFMITINNTDVTAVSAAALGNKLLQFCNGSVYDEDSKWHEVHNEKIKALKEFIEDNPSENVLVAYNFKSDLERLQKAFPHAATLDTAGKTQAAWNEGKLSLLLAHPASAGHGLNLQHGGCIVVWFGLNWSLELYQQFNARLDRQGQKRQVRIVHFVASGGIDEKVMLALKAKAQTQQQLLDYLKDSLRDTR